MVQILRPQSLSRRDRLFAIQHPLSHGAIKQPRIEIGKAEIIRHRPRDGALARRCGPVDCNCKSHGQGLAPPAPRCKPDHTVTMVVSAGS